MIDASVLLSFVAVSIVVILAPGSDVLLLIRSSMEGGKRLGFATFAGIHVGNLVLTTLVASGLGAVVSRNHALMQAVQMVGGLYLLWLAWGAAKPAVSLWRARAAGTHDDVAAVVAPSSPAQAFMRGLVTNLTNVKVLIFYVSFFPQFLGDASSVFAQLELLAVVFIAIAMVWEGLVMILAARMQHLMQRPLFAVCLDALCAVIFAALGILILVEALGGF